MWACSLYLSSCLFFNKKNNATYILSLYFFLHHHYITNLLPGLTHHLKKITMKKKLICLDHKYKKKIKFYSFTLKLWSIETLSNSYNTICTKNHLVSHTTLKHFTRNRSTQYLCQVSKSIVDLLFAGVTWLEYCRLAKSKKINQSCVKMYDAYQVKIRSPTPIMVTSPCNRLFCCWILTMLLVREKTRRSFTGCKWSVISN